MEKDFAISASELPTDFDMCRITPHLYERYKEELIEVKEWNLISIIRGAKFQDDTKGDKDKTLKWFRIGSYFYYKIRGFPIFADKLHLILGTFCFLKAIRSEAEGNYYFKRDLAAISAGRLINYWVFFPEEMLRQEFIKVGKIRHPAYIGDNYDLYNSAFMGIYNGLIYRFVSQVYGMQNDYRDYITKSEFDNIELWLDGIEILFDQNYEARTEIIENNKKYLDILWEVVSSDEIVKNNLN